MGLCSDCIFQTCHKPSCTFKQAGGNQKNFYIINKCWLDSASPITYLPNPKCCVIATIPLDTVNNPQAGWISVTAIKDTISVTETVTLPNKFILQSLTFQITNVNDNANAAQGYCEASSFAQQLMNSDEGFVVLIQNRLGVWVAYGLTTGLEVSAGVKTTGSVIADVASNTITFEAGEPEYGQPVDPAHIEAMIKFDCDTYGTVCS